jgi:hypothetical protein
MFKFINISLDLNVEGFVSKLMDKIEIRPKVWTKDKVNESDVIWNLLSANRLVCASKETCGFVIEEDCKRPSGILSDGANINGRGCISKNGSLTFFMPVAWGNCPYVHRLVSLLSFLLINRPVVQQCPQDNYTSMRLIKRGPAAVFSSPSHCPYFSLFRSGSVGTKPA